MKLQEIINVKFDEQGEKILRKALSKTKWLERFSENPKEIDLLVLEKLYRKIIKKYKVGIAYIQNATEKSMLCMIKNYETNQWVETIYFINFWECMAKVILVQYGYCIKGINFKDKERKG